MRRRSWSSSSWLRSRDSRRRCTPAPGSAAGLAVFGALTGISALAALFLGILLAG